MMHSPLKDLTIWKRLVLLSLVGMAGAHGEAVSDVFVAYTATWRSGMGGSDQANAAIYNQWGGANGIAAASGSPGRMNVIGTKESAHDATNEVNCGGMINWMQAYDPNVRDFIDAGNYLGADQFAYVGDMADNGAGAQAEQPGRFSCYEQQWLWQNVVAHETGGHNYGLDHGEGRTGPTTIMMHNYCAGGSQGFYSNPNIWLGGVQLIGGMSGCTFVGGADSTYHLSTSAQGKADTAERRVWGSWLGAPKYRWQFNQAAAAAPAGTTITDSVSGAIATVRGQGATFTGTGLRLPGGTTGNSAADSIAAYLDLPNGMFSAMPNFTIEIWATPVSAQNWMRVIEIGRTTEAGDGLGASGEYTGTPGSPAPGGTSSYDAITLTAAVGPSLNSQRLEAKLAGTGTVTADSSLATTAGEKHHYAITFADTTSGGTVKWFRDGVLIKTLAVGFHSASLHDVNNWLGRSLWSGDAMANIEYHDIRIQNAAITDGEVAGNYRIGAHDAKVTLWANDGFGKADWNGAWEGQAVPDATHDYEVGTLRFLTPWTTSNSTFPGRSVAVTGGNLFLTGKNAKTATFADLRLSNATIHSFGDNSSTQTLAGQINMAGNWQQSQFRGNWGELVVSANLVGSNCTMLFTEKKTTLTGTNTSYFGATNVGDGRFSTLSISKEENLGGNPSFYGTAWLRLNRGILATTSTMTLDDANRGIEIAASGGFISPAAGTTLTVATTINSPAAGNTLQTAPLNSNPILGIFFKDGPGTLILTNPNNSHNAEMQVLQGELRIDGAGRINNGDHWMPIALNGTLNYNSTATQTLRGVMSGSGSLIKNNTATLNLNGANTLAGSITVNAGTLYANPGNAPNNRACSFVSGITVNAGGTLKVGANGLFGWDGTQSRPVTINSGATMTTDGANTDVNIGTITLKGGTLTGFSSPAWGSWNLKRVSGAKLVVTENSTVSAPNVGLGTSNSIDVSSGKTLTFSGTITDLTNEGVSTLVKSNGTGTLVLSNTNTYTGATTVNAGTLHLTGSLAAGSAVSVANGATFSGNGTVNGSLSFATGAIHAPGNPTGAQTVNGALAYANGSRVRWILPSNSDTAGVANRISAATVNVTAGAVIDLVLNGSGSTANFTDTFWTQSHTWPVMTASNKAGDFTLGTVTSDAGNRPAGDYGTFTLQQSATAVAVVFTPTPSVVTSPTDLWRQSHFGAEWNNPAISGDAIDGDNDGLSNLLEYALGSDPNAADATAAPQVSIAANKLRIAFHRNTDAADITLSVVAADDLAGPWSTIATSTNGEPFAAVASGATVEEQGAPPLKSVQAEDIYLIPDPAHPKRFMRLQVQR